MVPSNDTTSLKVNRTAKTLRVLALENLRQAILSGHFKPGERLIERNLCDQLDVSRSIVREALRHLETEGLVESVAHQGPVVARLDADQAAQIYELRGMLESHAAGLCAEHASEETIQQLCLLNDRIQQAFKDADHQEVLVRTTAFYEVLFNGCGQTVAWNMVQTLNARINRLRALTISANGRSREAAKEMKDLVDALRRRDPQAARAASLAHIQRVAQLAIEALQRLSTSAP
jgi:GntR family transcriptional regulator, trigonelline degradation regulator